MFLILPSFTEIYVYVVSLHLLNNLFKINCVRNPSSKFRRFHGFHTNPVNLDTGKMKFELGTYKPTYIVLWLVLTYVYSQLQATVAKKSRKQKL